MTCGVPQGSILGPLLFSVYTNDLSLVLQRWSSQSYVDDTKLIFPFQLKDTVYAVTDLNNDLLQIAEWCSNNYLLLNPSKTKLMVFGSRQMRSKLRPFSLHFMGKELLPVNTVEDSGVFLDSNRTFDEHVTKLYLPVSIDPVKLIVPCIFLTNILFLRLITL